MITDDDIRSVFLAAGFTIKEGQSDLKPYVFEAGRKLAALAAAQERERMKADAESWGLALNEAAWKAIEVFPLHTGEKFPTVFFNHIKGILRDALATYFAVLEAAQSPETGKEPT